LRHLLSSPNLRDRTRKRTFDAIQNSKAWASPTLHNAYYDTQHVAKLTGLHIFHNQNSGDLNQY
jgi:hypothetical protein